MQQKHNRTGQARPSGTTPNPTVSPDHPPAADACPWDRPPAQGPPPPAESESPDAERQTLWINGDSGEYMTDHMVIGTPVRFQRGGRGTPDWTQPTSDCGQPSNRVTRSGRAGLVAGPTGAPPQALMADRLSSHALMAMPRTGRDRDGREPPDGLRPVGASAGGGGPDQRPVPQQHGSAQGNQHQREREGGPGSQCPHLPIFVESLFNTLTQATALWHLSPSTGERVRDRGRRRSPSPCWCD